MYGLKAAPFKQTSFSIACLALVLIGLYGPTKVGAGVFTHQERRVGILTGFGLVSGHEFSPAQVERELG